jgi:hypothetical protein
MRKIPGPTLVPAGVELALTLTSAERVVRLMPKATWQPQR